MKYYAICDVFEREQFEIRQYEVCDIGGHREWKYWICEDELTALRECNELNQEMDAEFKCVVVEMEV